ncbi:hypothetical protein A9Q83_06625 [Alphaproteobacteria bacterium 46_93_T64]|nr:hypothetical protein A9Q83_06625 [Alphaproteobacteria bacterium 46_93_T64]
MSDTSSENQGLETASAPSGAPTMAGKLMIPDLSGLTSGQMSNIETMSAVTNQAAATLQSIVTSQQSALVSAVENLQQSVEKTTTTAGISSNIAPDVAVQITNMNQISELFGQVSSTLTTTTSQSAAALTKSATESMAKIQETATKFSGG